MRLYCGPMLKIAHRGCPSRECSENTLEAFRAALAAGADGIELDLRCSRDGEIVVVHDTNLHRVAGDAHKVSELTADELSRIPLRFGGTIPLLADVTAAIHAPAVLDMEIKSREVTEAVIRKLKTSAALRERTIVSSFQPSILARVKRETPDVRTLLLVLRWPLPFRGRRLWNRVRALGPWGVAFPLNVLNPLRIAHLRRMGFAAGTWDRRGTSGEAKRAKRLAPDVAIVRNVADLH